MEMVSLDYLDEERKKLWERILSLENTLKNKIQELEDALDRNTSDYTKEAKGSSKMASMYRNRSEKAQEETAQILTESQETLARVKDIENSANLVHESISEFSSNCLKKNELTNENYSELESRLASSESQIIRVEELLEKHPDLAESLGMINTYYSNAVDMDNKIASLYKSVAKRKNDIERFYYDIKGYIDTDDETGEETQVKGLIDHLEQSYDEIKKDIDDYQNHLDEFIIAQKEKVVGFVSDWNIKTEQITERIESLLPNAMTAGLSHAYSKKKKAEEKESELFQIKFQNAIWGLVVVSIIPFVINLILLINGEPLKTIILDLPRMAFSIMPLYVPLLWLAYSANKNLNLSKRLVEEYTHKEVLSKTFEGLSGQISEINDKDMAGELKLKLIYNILNVSSENPGKLITDYNKADHPLMDALDKSVQLANAVDKLSKIPGLSRIAKMVETKSKGIVEEQAEKVNVALDSLEEKVKPKEARTTEE